MEITDDQFLVSRQTTLACCYKVKLVDSVYMQQQGILGLDKLN